MVRPIDVQHVILQTNAIEKVQQVQQHHSRVQQEYLGLQLKEEKTLAEERVRETAEAEKLEIRDREKDKRRQSAGRDGEHSGKDNQKEDAERGSESESAGRFIDIKV